MADNILTRKIGPLPGWAWGVGAAGLGVVYFYMAGRSQSQVASGSTAGQPALSPAASSIPFVPSVTVTGLNPNTAPGTSTGTAPPTPGTVMPNLGEQAIWLHTAPSPKSPVATVIQPGTSLNVAGPPVQGESYTSPQLGVTSNSWVPVDWHGLKVYAFGPEVTYGTSGSGGKGGYGVVNVTPMMGWTTGWAPLNSAQAAIGGAGGGDGGSPNVNRRGGSNGGPPRAASRTRGRFSRPVVRRRL